MSASDTTVLRSTEILQVARRLLLEEGLDNFVMRRIADLAEMRLGNLQYYFPTRDDLLEAILRAEFEADLAALQESTGTKDAPALLGRTVRLLVDRWLADEGNVYTPIGALALHDDRFKQLWNEVYGQFYVLLGALIERIDTAASASEIRVRAILITSLIDGATIQAYDDPTRQQEQAVANEIEVLAAAIAVGSNSDPYA